MKKIISKYGLHNVVNAFIFSTMNSTFFWLANVKINTIAGLLQQHRVSFVDS